MNGRGPRSGRDEQAMPAKVSKSNMISAIIAIVIFLLPDNCFGAERSRYFYRLQDTLLRAQQSLMAEPPDSLAAQPPLDSSALAAQADSLRRQSLYDSLDRIFWGEIDTTTLPCFDSLTVAWADSIARLLPDTTDIKRLKRKLRREERDSLKAAKPRVMETWVLPDSLYYRRILVWTSEKKFNEITLGGLDTTANSNYTEYPMHRKDVGASYLGPIGSATQYYNWFKREEVADAPMFTPYIGDSFTDENIPQYNTKTPYTERHQEDGRVEPAPALHPEHLPRLQLHARLPAPRFARHA